VPCKLSMLAIGRREWKRSARCIAGNGDVEAGVGCEAMEPAEERLAISGCNVSLGKARFEEGRGRSVPDCAESLRSIAPLIASLIALPSLLYAAFASPRLVVNTFKHTLRGGISSLFLLILLGSLVWDLEKKEGAQGISRIFHCACGC
jgi:hypothetical protein